MFGKINSLLHERLGNMKIYSTSKLIFSSGVVPGNMIFHGFPQIVLSKNENYNTGIVFRKNVNVYVWTNCISIIHARKVFNIKQWYLTITQIHWLKYLIYSWFSDMSSVIKTVVRNFVHSSQSQGCFIL